MGEHQRTRFLNQKHRTQHSPTSSNQLNNLKSKFYSKLKSIAALTKSRNNGCGFCGRDKNSGWNCPATNQRCCGFSIISTNPVCGLIPEKTNPAFSNIVLY